MTSFMVQRPFSVIITMSTEFIDASRLGLEGGSSCAHCEDPSKDPCHEQPQHREEHRHSCQTSMISKSIGQSHSYSSPLISPSSNTKLVDDLVDRFDVTVFTDESGLHCSGAVASLLNSPLLECVSVRTICVTSSSSPSLLKRQLDERTGSSVFPIVFVHGDFLGGNEQVEEAMRIGTLEGLMSETDYDHLSPPCRR
jgi:glutaredoxin-related protein